MMKTVLLVCAATIGAALSLAAQSSTPSAPSTQAAPSKPSTSTTKKKTTAATAGAHKTTTAGANLVKTQKDKESYAFGMNLGKSLHRQGVELDPNFVAEGLKDAFLDRKTQLTDDEAKAILIQLQQKVRTQAEAKMAMMAAANKKEGDEFLATNKSKEGVVTLPSGLEYKILKEGTGPKPTADDTVVCNYRGTLINGTEFDSSYKRNEPATFPVNRVIKGWTEALQLMPVGSKWQLFVPANLAYGENSPGPEIPPNSTLIFEVELLSIKPKAQ